MGWLPIGLSLPLAEAAEALASIGSLAMPVLPDLLTMLAEHDVETDPRGMQQRYLCFALFDQRSGMLARSLDGVDRQLLYTAVTRAKKTVVVVGSEAVVRAAVLRRVERVTGVAQGLTA